MNRIVTLCMVLLLQVAAYAQGLNSSDYNPENPPGPNEEGYADAWPQITLTATPDFAGHVYYETADNSQLNDHIEAGKEVTVWVYANNGFGFRAWVAGNDTISKEEKYTFTMPATDVSLCAVFYYNPDNPEHPHANVWNRESGELIITDFQPGRLDWKIGEVTYRDPWNSDWTSVKSLTVAGKASNGEEALDDWQAFSSTTNLEFLDMSRTSGLNAVPPYCFSSNPKLATLVLPATTASIGVEAFRDCHALTEVTCFATTPPEFKGELPGEESTSILWGESGPWAFDGLTTDNIVVHVPAESVPLYQEARGWNMFMLLPITQGVQRLTVSLPQAQNYRNMFLELANNQTGQNLRYVITDATSYTFNNLIRDTHHTLYIKNQRGVVMGTVEGIDIVDKDVQVSFADLKAPRDVTLRLTLPDGSDAGSDAYTVTWTDRLGNYLGADALLAGQTEGSQVLCHVRLDETLGRQFLAPADTVYTVDQNATLAIALKAIPTQTFSGVVASESTGLPLRAATVTVSQTLNGLYNATQKTRTDADGRWTLTALEAPTTVTAQATNYIPHTDTLAVGSMPVDTIALRDLTGTFVNLDLYYYPTVAEGVEPLSEDYADYENVSYTVYDETHGQEVTETAVQYPQLILIEKELEEGTTLQVTARSLTDDFKPVTATCKVNADNQAFATIGITERGRLHAKFSMTDNQKVMGVLYDAEGTLVGWSPYSNTELTVNNLADGQYTLVTMGYNTLFTSVGSLTALAETGIGENSMVKNTVAIQSGRITEVSNTSVPTFREDDFRLTGEGTSFTVNKTEVTVGQYVTLKAVVDFKASVAAAADVKLVVDLPEGCEYVQQSMMMGSRSVTPQQEGRRLTLSLEDPTQAVRFCVVPTQSGILDPVAYVSFMNNGQRVTQPIGSAPVTAEALTISVPETTGRRLLPVTGMATPLSTVQLYDGDVLVGETTASGTGYWSAMAELHEPYNLSSHTIYAIVTNSEGMKMQSEVKTVTVNRSSLTPVVTMHLKGTSSEHHKRDFVFDFRTGEVNPNGMKLTDFGEFTLDFNVDFYDQNDMMVNDTTAIRNVKLYVMMEHGEVFTFPLKYSQRYKDWYLATDYNAGNMPVNVDLDYTIVADVAADRQELDDMMEETEIMMETNRQEVLDVYRVFDAEPEPEEKSEINELASLLQIATPDDATNQRIDMLVRAIVGDSLMDAVTKHYREMVDADSTLVLEGISEANLESLLDNLDKEFADIDREHRELRDSLLSVMSIVYLPDTTVFHRPETVAPFIVALGDKYQEVEVRRLTVVNRDQLLSEGYIEMPMTDGSSVYRLSKDSLLCFIDSKTLTMYSLLTLDATDAEARMRRAETENAEVKVEPVTGVLELFPVGCVTNFKQFGDNIKEDVEVIKKTRLDLESFINLTVAACKTIDGAIGILECLYDWGRGELGEVVDAIFLGKAQKAQRNVNKATETVNQLRTEIANQRAIMDGNLLSKQRHTDAIRDLQEKLTKATTQAEKDRLTGMIGARRDLIQNLEEANSKIAGRIGKLNGKFSQASTKLLKARNAYSQLGIKKFNMMRTIDQQLPKKFNLQAKLANNKVFQWFSNPPVSLLLKAIPFGVTCYNSTSDVMKWIDVRNRVLGKMPCEGNETEAQKLLSDCEQRLGLHVVSNLVTVAGEGFSLAASTVPTVPLVDVKWWASRCLDLFNFVWSCWQPTASENDRKGIEERLANLKCGKKPSDDDSTGKTPGTLPTSDSNKKNDGKNNSSVTGINWNFQRLWYVRDPSGYVYEGVSSNRVEGVRASCYYKEEVEDMYGDLYDRVVFWDAENYEQENPLYTDADGRYAWDVPTGWWQVKYEKEGYETTYSDWLPVPPPQLEVNVGITQLRQPAVSRVAAYENAIELEFDKYMDLATLNKANISVTKGGKTLDGHISLLNAEAGYQKPDVKYASRLAFVPKERLQFNEKVVLTVRRQVESYAGLQMESDYQQEFTVTNDTLAVEFDPTLADSTAMVVATPTASRISGTTVSPGATVTLSCATEGATIWYTTDGTCPCDENGSRRRYAAPIVINGHLLLKAYAVKGVMQESEVATFEYFVTGGDMTVTTSAAGFATFYDSQTNYRLPSQLQASCIVTDNSKAGGIRYVGLPDGIIPKGVAVAIRADVKKQQAYTLTAVADAAPYTGENLLHGSDVATTTTAAGDCDFYKACYGPSGTALANWFGWFPANSAKGPFRSEAHRAWLAIPKSMGTRSYYDFGDGATGIAAFDDSTDEKWYDIQGRRVDQPRRPGVYIKNRRKAVVK